MTSNRSKLIFTDLDGTLLDHDTYSWEAAKPALALALEKSIPVIPCTSKTLEECLKTQQLISLKGPFIFENGSGIALPKSASAGASEKTGFSVRGLGIPYDKIRYQLLDLRRRMKYQFRGFGDMTVEQVCELTGLSESDARYAMKRRFSEPLVWLDDAKTFDAFAEDVRRADLTMTRGGRFVHISGAADKGKAMLWLAKFYAQKLGAMPTTIALGDSMNDLPMLKEADISVVIRPRHANPIKLVAQRENQKVITTEKIGPEGWNEAILSILN